MSDNLKLGQIITTPQNRDAIHIAVAPVKAGWTLMPGQRVSLENGTAQLEVRGNAVGIVDPFLQSNVKTGQTFWLFLFPGTITALRHEWTHPAFASEKPQDLNAPLNLKSFAERIGCTNEQLLARLDVYARGSCWDDDSIHDGLNALGDELLVGSMWDVYEQVRGTKVPDDIKGNTSFRCAC